MVQLNGICQAAVIALLVLTTTISGATIHSEVSLKIIFFLCKL